MSSEGTFRGKDPRGERYKWSGLKQSKWAWRDSEPVLKTWVQFLPLNWRVGTLTLFKISSAINRNITKDTVRDLKVAERPSFSFSEDHRQPISISERSSSHSTSHSKRSVKVREKSNRDVLRDELDTIKFKERQHSVIETELKEAVEFLEASNRTIEFIRSFVTNIKVRRQYENQIETNKSESLSVKSDKRFNVKIEEPKFIYFSEDFQHTWGIERRFEESLSFVEEPDFKYGKSARERFEINEHFEKDYGKRVRVALKIVDVFSRTVSFNKYFEENFEIDNGKGAEKLAKLPFKDQFKIVDEFLKGGVDGVFSDFSFLSEALNDSDFEEMLSQSSPDGYKEFVPFIPGDYEYQEALVRIIMRSRDLSRPYINQIRYEVDLPDLFDNGQATLKAERTKIYFSKNFNPDEPPALSVTVKSGATKFVPAVDFDIQPDNKSFEVELKNPDTGTLVAGKIVWRAQGY